MKTVFEFLKTTLVGGFFVVLPVALVLLLIVQAVDAVATLAAPATEDLAVETILGIDVAVVLAILLVLALCFVTGLLMRTRLGASAGQWFERSVLTRLPGYTLLRTLTRRLAGTEDSAQFAAALARLHGGDAQALVFIIEEHANGDYTVFLPMSPTPTLGVVYTVPRDHVVPLATSFPAAVGCVANWGIGTKDLIQAR